MAIGIAAGVIVGVAVAIALSSGAWRPARRAPVPTPETIEYGQRLLVQTSELLGPDGPDARMRYTGSHLECASCHHNAGADPGTLSLLQTASNYPRPSGRDGGVRDLQDRINGCMERSMNGRPLPRDGAEILAMVAYIDSLGRRWAALDAAARAAHEQPPFKTPDRAASLDHGRQVYQDRCAVCHRADGSGLRTGPRAIDGYVLPPLWGPDSFNTGAGMHRVLTAARFIKARMPLGAPNLTDDQAFDVAAYINAQPRPEMAGLDRDYPDRSTKPIDCPYGPYDDPFPPEQHRLGPFAPVQAYYADRKKAMR